MKQKYVTLMRRRRETKTDYRKRKSIIISRMPFVSIHASSKNITVQFLTTRIGGDLCLASAHSRELLKYGWKGSRKNFPASYLTGFLAGLKVKDKINKAIVYVGLRSFIHGSRITASIKGILDAGISIPVDSSALPSDDRIKGMHIVKYAKELSEKDASLYRSKFKSLLDNGFDPLNYDKYFNETRDKIIKQYGVEK